MKSQAGGSCFVRADVHEAAVKRAEARVRELEEDAEDLMASLVALSWVAARLDRKRR